MVCGMWYNGLSTQRLGHYIEVRGLTEVEGTPYQKVET
jgi:hypothetical protein